MTSTKKTATTASKPRRLYRLGNNVVYVKTHPPQIYVVGEFLKYCFDSWPLFLSFLDRHQQQPSRQLLRCLAAEFSQPAALPTVTDHISNNTAVAAFGLDLRAEQTRVRQEVLRGNPRPRGQAIPALRPHRGATETVRYLGLASSPAIQIPRHDEDVNTALQQLGEIVLTLGRSLARLRHNQMAASILAGSLSMSAMIYSRGVVTPNQVRAIFNWSRVVLQ